MPRRKSGGILGVDRTNSDEMTPIERPVAGYIRVSRIGGRSGDGYISPDEQRQQIESYAKELGVYIPKDAWGDDQDFSGGNFDRPGWESVVRRIESGELSGVIVLRVDRFARNVPDGAAQIRHIVEECKGIFGSAQERMDPSTPAGLYMLQQFLNNAELQLNMLKGSWKIAKERAIARGAHIGPTPLGYGRVPKGEDRSGCLFPLTEWKPVIEAIFKYAGLGDGDRLIAKRLNEEHGRPDGRNWSSTTVGHVIANRVYLGEVAYRPRTEEFAPLINTEAHEPIVSEATWLAAQRKPGVQRTGAGHVNLLAGLIRCAGCRYRMNASRGGGNIRVYRCAKHHGGGVCPAPATVKAERVEAFVLGEVQGQWQPRFALTVGKQPSSASAEEIANRLAEARSELETFANDLSARRILGETYHGALEARVKAVGAVEAEWDALENERKEAAGSDISWQSLDRGELREVLGGALDAVYIRRGRGMAIEDRACLIWSGDLDDDAPTRGKPVTAFRSFEWPENNRASVGKAAA